MLGLLFGSAGKRAGSLGSTTLTGSGESRKRREMRAIGLAAAFLCAAIGAASAAPVQWTAAVGGNGHWYEAAYVPVSITWTAASDAATAAGGYLATLTSEPENQFVYNLISDDKFWHLSGNNNGPWIGGYQDCTAPGYSEPGGGWRWVTDEPFAYTNWAPNQPDNGWGTGEDYMGFFGWGNDKTSKWNDARNVEPILGYLVEYAQWPVPEPSVLVALLCGLGGFVWRARPRRVAADEQNA